MKNEFVDPLGVETLEQIEASEKRWDEILASPNVQAEIERQAQEALQEIDEKEKG